MSKDRIPVSSIHPGKTILEDYLTPLGIKPEKLAKTTHIKKKKIKKIIRGEKRISRDTALRLGIVFRTSPEFWLNLQQHYDLEVVKRRIKPLVKKNPDF
ncbi:MAG: HigA family addiction module antidote protein [Leptolinea sp.]|jgi:addiction module HigA family antidote|nr:HigA family addiction module antidote protein [Leptolinea sp.]